MQEVSSTFGIPHSEVEGKQFNDRALNRDVAMLCTRVAKAQPHLQDGRRLFFSEWGASRSRLDVQEQVLA
jgi:hypothetical protein